MFSVRSGWSLMLSLATDHWTFMSSSGVRTSFSKLSFSLIEAFLLCFSSFIIDINTFLSVSSGRMCQTCTHSPTSCSVHSSFMFSLLSEGWPGSRWLLMEKLHVCRSKSSGTVWGPPVKCDLVFSDGSEAKMEWVWDANVMCCAGELTPWCVRLRCLPCPFFILKPKVYFRHMRFAMIHNFCHQECPCIQHSLNSYATFCVLRNMHYCSKVCCRPDFLMFLKSLMLIKASFIWSNTVILWGIVEVFYLNTSNFE